jgi:hypothetical protein
MGGCIVPSESWIASDEGVGVPSKSKKAYRLWGFTGRAEKPYDLCVVKKQLDEVGKICENARIDGE